MIIGTQHQSDKAFTVSMVKKIAKELLIKQGYVSPQYIIEKKSDKRYITTVAILIFANDKEKKEQMAEVRKLVSVQGAETVYFFMEAWMTMGNPKLPFIRASEARDKKSTLVLSKFQKDNPNVGLETLMPFTKIGKEIRFEEEIGTSDITEAFTIWNPFIELDGVMERTKKKVEEHNDKFIDEFADELFEKFGKKFNSAETDEEKIKIIEETKNEIIKRKQEFDRQKAVEDKGRDN